MKYTTLVNKENPIKENYLTKVELIKTKDIVGKEILIEKETLSAYEELKKSLEKENIKIGIDSAYRSIEYQEELRNKIIKEQGEKYALKYVALPKESEHHTGLALDIAIYQEEKWIEEEQENNKHIFQKIHKKLSDFGFILRYPKEKENITGYSYEPWHIRYVGKVPAKMIAENNFTLEEYLKEFSTIIYINKPKGITSFDVVHEISKIFGIKKVGHTGTLDPLAEGVLLVAIGKATKIVELLTAKDKEYIATFELGYQTDTYDNTGRIINRKEVPEKRNIQETLKSFQKTYLQEVPIYSAVKVKGKKLYDYARKQEEVELPKKEVTIKEIECLEEKENQVTFRTLVTKGCYIRSLINDIGLSLNTYATMTNLIRTKQGSISIEQTNTLEEIKEGKTTLHTIEEVLDYPIIKVDDNLAFKIKNGVVIPNQWNIQDKVIFHTKENKLLGIYEKEKECLKVWKNFS